MITVLAGGVAMTTPGTPGPVVATGHRFQLANDPPKERGDRLQITFKDGHGIKPGDVLRHRGITLGEVYAVTLAPSMQAVEVEIDLLPALPQSWSEGTVKGMRLRGNLELDMEWSEGKLERASFKALSHGSMTVYYSAQSVKISYKADDVIKLEPNLQVVK